VIDVRTSTPLSCSVPGARLLNGAGLDASLLVGVLVDWRERLSTVAAQHRSVVESFGGEL
jgi:hypothetical protein